jgi:hypothetical protein
MFLLLLATALLVVPQPDLETTELDRIRPGMAGATLTEALGEAFATERREDLLVEHFRKSDAGIADATMWCDEEGTVLWARVHLVNELSPRVARLLFNLVGGKSSTDGHAFAAIEKEMGRTVHYASDGVHFFIEGNIVREIWRTEPRVDPAEIRAASGARWPALLPVEEEPKEEPEAEPDESAGGIPLKDLLGEEDLEGMKEGELDPSGMGRPPAGHEERAPKADFSLPVSFPLLSVGQVITEVVDSPGGIAAKLQGKIRAVGLKGEKIHAVGFFCEPDGIERIHVAPDAPRETRGPRNCFRLEASDTVQHPDAAWNEMFFLFPLQYASGSGNLNGKFVLSMEAYCGGKAAYCSGEVTLSRPGAPPSRPDRRIWLGDELRTEETTIEGPGPGFLVIVPVEVRNCKGLSLSCQVSLEKANGDPVRAARGWDSWRSMQGNFFSIALSDVLYDSSSWKAFRLFVPYGALELPAGKQPLVIRFGVRCENVGAALEFDHTIFKP